MLSCPSCGTENTPGSRFCASCGAALATACASCGGSLPHGARFCPACGSPVAAESSAGGEERKLVTVLFADVTGSSKLGEQLDPEPLREVLDRFFAAMREEIEAEGGTVEKFIGDAVMAAFGVPVAHEDDPARAVRAAVRMLRRLEDVNDELARSHDVLLQVRIGVNTGDVLATIDPRPGEAMVTGDTVNAAARLQTAADPGSIVIGERTAHGVRSFRLVDLGPLELKGKTQPLRAFRVDQELPLAVERGVPGLRAPLVGRDAELELLRSVFARVVGERRPNFVTIYGDAGVGKSRLTSEFLTWAEGTDPQPRIMRGRCLPYGEGITYWPLAEVLKSTASVLDTDPPDLVLDKIAKVSEAILTNAVTSDRPRTAAALAYTVGVEDPAFGFADMDPRDVRAELHAAWASFFSALGTSQPTIVIVEDIHWADAAMLDLLDELADRITGSVLFVCPSRPELTARRPGWGGGRRNFASIALDPLSADEAERLVRALLAIDDLPDAARARILERGEGNPFFLEEILRHLIDGGHVVLVDGRWRATDAIADVEIPDTVQGVLAARIDLLEPTPKRILQGAAVVGREFWPAPARGLSEIADEDADAALRVLLERDLIVSRLTSRISGQPEFSFKHVLTRDVAYESLPRRERSSAHARVAAWIEATAGDRVHEFNELLAYHFGTAARGATEVADTETSELREKAFNYLLAASHDTRQRQVLKKSQRLAEEALTFAADPLERSEALYVRGLAYFADYEGDPAWHSFLEAAHIRAAAVPPPDARVALLCARACDQPTRWPGSMREPPTESEVQACLDLGLSYVPEGDTEERVSLQAVRAIWTFAFARDYTEDELADFERAGFDAYEAADRLGLPNLASATLDATLAVPVSVGRYARAIEIATLRERLLPTLTDLGEIGDLTAAAAWTRYEIGDYRGSVSWANEGIRLTEGRAMSFMLHSQAWRCTSRFRLGDWDDALEDFRSISESLGERRDDPPYFTRHAFGAALLIDLARGRPFAEIADRLRSLDAGAEDRAVSTGTRAPARSVRWPAWSAMLAIANGDLARAHGWLDDLRTGWRVHGGELLEATCELVAAEGAWERAPDVLTRARAHAAAGGLAALSLFADRLEGLAALATGDPVVGAQRLLTARDGLATLGAAFERARTEVHLSRAFRELGRADEAADCEGKAVAEFERLGVVRPW